MFRIQSRSQLLDVDIRQSICKNRVFVNSVSFFFPQYFMPTSEIVLLTCLFRGMTLTRAKNSPSHWSKASVFYPELNIQVIKKKITILEVHLYRKGGSGVEWTLSLQMAAQRILYNHSTLPFALLPANLPQIQETGYKGASGMSLCSNLCQNLGNCLSRVPTHERDDRGHLLMGSKELQRPGGL